MEKNFTPGILSSTKKNLSLLLLSSALFLSCSKDILKSYERRIIGQWHIRDVKRIGIGGNIDFLPFQDGTFVFSQDGTLTYRNAANQQFDGTWEITRRTINDQVTQSLQITAIDFVNERVLSEYYDDLNFRSSDHFVGNTIENFRTYVTHFRR
ncbi:MAG: hypothetical protein ACXWV5_08515 [Flavitalea sp.]